MDMDSIENSTVKSIEDHEIVDLRSNDFESTLEKSKSHEGNPDKHQNLLPCVGLEFESLKDVEEFYISFAKKSGLGVRIRSTKENFCWLVCSKEGKHTVKNGSEEECNICPQKTKKKCSTSRTDCKVSLIVSKAWKRCKWVIKSFSNDHNHDMVSLKSVSYFRCHRKMSKAAKTLVEKFDKEVPTGKVASMFSGGDTSFSNRDCWNHLRNLRRKNLDIGDADDFGASPSPSVTVCSGFMNHEQRRKTQC